MKIQAAEKAERDTALKARKPPFIPSPPRQYIAHTLPCEMGHPDPKAAVPHRILSEWVPRGPWPHGEPPGPVRPRPPSEPLNFLSEALALAVRHAPPPMPFLCLTGSGSRASQAHQTWLRLPVGCTASACDGDVHALPRKRQAHLSKSTARAGQREHMPLGRQS